MGQPWEIGEAAAWLLSDAATLLTGLAMPVGGGMMIWVPAADAIAFVERSREGNDRVALSIINIKLIWIMGGAGLRSIHGIKLYRLR